jgi:hypothetical protein
MLIVIVDPSGESTDEGKRARPLLEPEALLFQGPDDALRIRVALGVVITREGLMDLQGAAHLHEGERGGLTAVIAHQREALAPGRSGHPDAERKAVELIDRGLLDTQGSLKRDYLYAAGEIETVHHVTLLAPHINALLEAQEDDLRAVAAWAAGSLGAALREQVDWARLRARAAADPDPLVRVEAVAALGKVLSHWADSAAIASLTDAAHDPDARVRYVAVQAMRLLAEDGGASISLAEAAEDPDHGVRFEGELLQLALAHPRFQLRREHTI